MLTLCLRDPDSIYVLLTWPKYKIDIQKSIASLCTSAVDICHPFGSPALNTLPTLRGLPYLCESGRISLPLRNWRSQILPPVPWNVGCWHMTYTQPAVCSCLRLWLLRKWHGDLETVEKFFIAEVAMSRAQWQSHHGKPSISFGGRVSWGWWCSGVVVVWTPGYSVFTAYPPLVPSNLGKLDILPISLLQLRTWWILIQPCTSNN